MRWSDGKVKELESIGGADGEIGDGAEGARVGNSASMGFTRTRSFYEFYISEWGIKKEMEDVTM